MQTLSFGFKQPEDGDKGSIWFPALAEDIQLLNDHDHDGLNSSKLSTRNFLKETSAIAAADWVLVSGGLYSQEVTMPAGVNYAEFLAMFQVVGGPHDGDTIFPSLEKGSSPNKYVVYVNDNTLALTATYV